MSPKFAVISAFLAATAMSPLSALADPPQAQPQPAHAPAAQPAPRPAAAASPSGSAQPAAAQTFDPLPPGPHIGPLQISNVSAMLGATDEGVAGGGSISVSHPNGSTAELDVVGGKPILRVNGSVSAIPLKILERKIKRKNGEVSVSMTFVPVTGDASLNISSIDRSVNFDAFLRPTIQSEIDASRGPVSGSVTARMAPLSAGVVYDSKGARPTVGSGAGVDVSLSIKLSETNRIDLSLSLDKYLAIAGQLASGPDLTGKVTFVHTTQTGQQLYIGPMAYTQRLDIIRRDQPIIGDTRAKFLGVTAGVAWGDGS